MPNLLLFLDDAIRISAVGYQPSQNLDADLSSYGWNSSYIKADHRKRQNAFANNWRELGYDGTAFFGGVPRIAFSSAHMQRGEVLPTFANTTVGIASYPALAPVISPLVRFFLPVLGVSGSAAAASLLAAVPAYGLGKAAAASVRWFNNFGYRLRRIEMGGDYTDTETAYAVRMKAVSDMSSAMSYSRRWLGNEALFMRS